MSALTHAALAALPPALAALIKEHSKRFVDETGDLVNECALLLAETRDPGTDMHALFNKARSRVRRATQPQHRGLVSLDEQRTGDADELSNDEIVAPRERRGSYRRALVERLARERGVTIRRAQQIVDEALRRFQCGDDLFAGGAV